MNQQSSIEARLARLERSNWRLRLGLALSLCGLAAIGLMGATAGVPRVIRAQRFVVVRPDGTQVDSFGLQSSGSRLYSNFTMGANLNKSLRLNNNGIMITHQSGGESRTTFLSDEGLLMMWSASSHLSGGGIQFAYLTPEGLDMIGDEGRINLDDGSQPLPPRLLRLLPLPRASDRTASAGPLLWMNGHSDDVLVRLGEPSPSISLADPAGFSMTLGGVGLVTETTGETHQTSAASIVMFGNDKKHHVIWQAPSQ